jgi:HK97 family phage prohead protease
MRTATAHLHRPDDLHVRALHQAERAVDVVMSTDAEDMHGEIVEQVWDTRAYERNPVLLLGHDSRSLPIGRVEHVRVEGGSLRGRIVLASAKANPIADQVWHSIVEGSLSACSVGFVPGEIRHEKRGGKDVVVLSKNRLLELSVVSIPANDQALMQRNKSVAIDAGREPPIDAFALAAKAVEREEQDDDA